MPPTAAMAGVSVGMIIPARCPQAHAASSVTSTSRGAAD
jgi:hypothetical protein